MNTNILYGSFTSCIKATFNLIINAILVGVATFNADVTVCHKWPMKTTILFNIKPPRAHNNHYIHCSKLICAIL